MKMLSPLPYSVHKGILIAKLSFVIQCFFFKYIIIRRRRRKGSVTSVILHEVGEVQP